MDKNNTIKVKSITDVITNSSTEVFTFYNDGGIKTIKDTVNAILAINSDNKYTFDDLFDIKYAFEFDRIDDDWYDDKLCLYLTEDENNKLVKYKASSEYQDRRYDKYLPFLNNEVSYETQKKIAFGYEGEDYENQGAVVFGVNITAKKDGEAYKNPSETWKKWMATYRETLTKDGILLTDRPFQIAIGSEGEPCATPYLCDFLKTVYETNVVPNYTTNGIVLSHWNNPESKYYAKANEILDATKKYAGGVAVSYGNKSLRKYADNAIDGLLAKGDCHVMIHHIISDNKSVDEFVECWKKYGDKIRNHVLLPLMASGRSKKGIEDGTFEYLENTIEALGIKNVAFGAHFIKSLEKSHKIKTWIYPAETYSKNVLLKENEVVITSSSFNLTPVKVIKL